MKMTLEEIAAAAKGSLKGSNIEITSISTDSRKIDEGCLFVALSGEKFDGHDFIADVVNKGAAAVVISKDMKCPCPCIKVENTRLALGDIARHYRKKFHIPFAAVTGSVGKTTTKDMIASVLSQKYNTLKTEGNFNNDIGVPLTLFRLTEDTECAVIEMGMNHFNEISYLTSIAVPDIAVITNVGVSHIENLGSRDGILKAKCEIFESMAKDSLKVLNGDDDKLITVKDKYGNICYYSTEGKADIYADSIISKGIEGIGCTIHRGDISFEVNIPIPGRHMVGNALAAAAVAFELGLTPKEIKNGIENFVPTGKRMDIIKTGKYTIVDDTYNANPQSVKAGIDVIAESSGISCCILGDMLELGEMGAKLHYDTGKYAAEKNINTIICIGPLSKNMYEGAMSVRQDNVYYFESQDTLFKEMEEIIPKGAVILVKASRGMHFEKTTERLRGDK